MLKPDGAAKLFLPIKKRIVASGLVITDQKKMSLSQKLAKEFYASHRGKRFFPGLIDFITAGPVVPMIVEGVNAIARMRKLMGPTDPKDASRGTIRGDLQGKRIKTKDRSIIQNVVHGSDEQASARREIKLIFSKVKF